MSESRNIQDAVQSREFYDLMQAYRHAPLHRIVEVANAFEAVKTFLVERAASLAPVAPTYDDLPDLMTAGRWQEATMLLIAKVDALYKAAPSRVAPPSLPCAACGAATYEDKRHQRDDSKPPYCALCGSGKSGSVAPPSGAQTGDRECCYGHKARVVGCVSCVLVFDRAIPELAIPTTSPLPRETEPEALTALVAEMGERSRRMRALAADAVGRETGARAETEAAALEQWSERLRAILKARASSAPPVGRPDMFDVILKELSAAKAVMLTGTTDPGAAFPPESYRDEANAYDVEAAVLRKYRQRLTAPASGPSDERSEP